MKHYSIILILFISLAACDKPHIEQAQPPANSTPQRVTKNINYLLVKSAVPVTQDTATNFITTYKLGNDVAIVGDAIWYERKGYYEYSTDTNRTNTTLFYLGRKITPKSIKFNRDGVIRLTIAATPNSQEILASRNRYYNDYYEVDRNIVLTIDFQYGGKTDYIDNDTILLLLNKILDRTNETKFIEY